MMSMVLGVEIDLFVAVGIDYKLSQEAWSLRLVGTDWNCRSVLFYHNLTRESAQNGIFSRI